MQLKKHTFIRGALAAATCTVLNGTAHATQPVDSWKIDGGVLYYAEQDRISVVKPVVHATKQTSAEESYTLRFVYDTMTGATPIGAAPSAQAQTITSASGESIVVAPGEMPMKKFSDTRVAFGVDWLTVPSRLEKLSRTLNFSAESDYISLGGNLAYSIDSENRMNTYTYGIGLSLDTVSPKGGAPVGMQSISFVPSTTTTVTSASGDDDDDDDESHGEHKRSLDLLIGTTKVLSRRSLLQLNYTHSLISGYLTDPYKMVSIVDSNGLPLDYVWEKRPSRRDANILYAKWVYHLPQDVVHLSYRYFQDNCGIRSHTADLNYRLVLPQQVYLEPHLRYYTQTQADFYYTSLANNLSVKPSYASADYRLAEMTSRSVGIKVGVQLEGDREVSFRYETMVQRGDNHPANAIGTQQGLDLYPGLDATIMQISFSTLL